ncbi:MAG: hypothetical protein K9H25_04535 [Rhodospirillum sp.]|nr:hypothetical protein [Rhodospirillum sp.]
MWFWDRATWPRSFLHNVPLTARLRGPLDRGVLEEAFAVIIARQEALRSSFNLIGPHVYQSIDDTLSVPMRHVDLSTVEVPWEAYEAFSLEEARMGFDLREAPLIRATLVRLADDDHVLLVTAHHISWDGWSTGMLVYELATHYRAIKRSQRNALPALPVQYADWAAWQHRYLAGSRLKELQDYWRAELAGARTVHVTPARALPSTGPSDRGKTRSFSISEELTLALQHLGKEEDATLFMVLMAALTAMLHGLTGEDDLTVGGLISNRTTTGLEGLIGYFVNTVVMRSRSGPAFSFREHLRAIRSTTMRSYQHQALPIGCVARLAAPLRPEGFDKPLYSVDFVFQSSERPETDFGDINLTVPDRNTRTADYDMGLVLWQRLPDLTKTRGLEGWWEYKTCLFDDADARDLIDRFVATLVAIAQTPDTRMSTLPPFPRESHGRGLPSGGAPERRSGAALAKSAASFVSEGSADETSGLLSAWTRMHRDPDAMVTSRIDTSDEAEGALEFTGRAVIDGVAILCDCLALRPDDYAVQLEATVEMEVWAVSLACLSSGARVRHIAAPLHSDLVTALIFEEAVTVLHIRPEHLSPLLNILHRHKDHPRRLRTVFVSADRIGADSVRAWRATCPEIELVRAYWPVVCAGPVTWHRIKPDSFIDPRWENLGQSLAGQWLHILDRDANPAVPGAKGRLYVAGSLLAASRGPTLAGPVPDLVPDPSGSYAHTLMAATGAWARRNHEDEAEQYDTPPTRVRIGGRHVALARIDAALEGLDGVEKVVTTPVRGLGDVWHAVSYVAFKPLDGEEAESDLLSLWRQVDAAIAKNAPEGEILDLAHWTLSHIGEDDDVLVLGAGARGSPSASIGSRRKPVDSIGFGQIDMLRSLPLDAYDVVVFDGVTRFLAGATTFDRLLATAVDKVRSGGKILLTKVTNLALRPAQVSAWHLSGAADDTPFSAVRNRVERSLRQDMELSLCPTTLQYRALAFRGLCGATLHPRLAASSDAQAPFTYDAVLFVGGATPAPHVFQTFGWRVDRGLAQLDGFLTGSQPDRLVIEAFQDRRILSALAAERAFDEILPGATIADITRATAQPERLATYEDLHADMSRRGYRCVEARLSGDPRSIDLLFSKKAGERFERWGPAPRSAPEQSDWTNSPARNAAQFTKASRLRALAETTLPRRLCPSLIIPVEDFPEFPAGGINIFALPAVRVGASSFGSDDGGAARLLSRLWADRNESIGDRDDALEGSGLMDQLAVRAIWARTLRQAGHGQVDVDDPLRAGSLEDLARTMETRHGEGNYAE